VSTTLAQPPAKSASLVHRFEVRVKPGLPDPRSDSVQRGAANLGIAVAAAQACRVYLIQGDLTADQRRVIGQRLLADLVVESVAEGVSTADGLTSVEIHPLPGVMDPAAQSVQQAVNELVGANVQVSTGWRYDLRGITIEQAVALAQRLLANGVVQQIHTTPWHPKELPHGGTYTLKLRNILVRGLTDDQLTKLSREAHLFLSLPEMQAVRAEYERVGREPTDIELETIAQTWSEHCVHKTLKSTIRYTNAPAARASDPIDWSNRPGHVLNLDGSITINNLLKSTVAAATFELIADGIDWTLSVFTDNSGVIALDEEWGVCVKVETHNHPSAIEPYGGAATGAGGCIRDVMGTGLGAKPIANTDIFCVAFPNLKEIPPGAIHPKRTLTEVVAGVRDYGNRMGIPTLNGAVWFDDRYVGNPLVFCGCIGLIPRDGVTGVVKPGDRIIAIGGRTGRDGIHGATFSSAELEHTAADEFSHAVQIGNAIEEKRVMDAILRARDGPALDRGHTSTPSRALFNAITDCGAGGFSSAVGEMGSKIGAEVHLDRAPVKYAGLSYTEIWISEAQERMVLAVSPHNVAALQKICDEEHVELADLGHFGTEDAQLKLFYHGTPVGQLSMHLLHDGIPTPTREAIWSGRSSETAKQGSSETGGQRDSESGKAHEEEANFSSSPVSLSRSIAASLLSLLSHPNIASKHWLIRQYDHEVQGNTVIKPLVGPGGRGPGDAAVIEPIFGSGRGVAIGCGLATGLGDPRAGGDPYWMTLAAIDECVRNLVCVGADPSRIAILDNFCWPSCEKPENLGTLVRAAEGCYDGAKAYRTPFVSGKDSLNNQFKVTDLATGATKTIEIPPTLLISGIGIVPSTARCVTMDAKEIGNLLVVIGATKPNLGGSHYQRMFELPPRSNRSDGCETIPETDLKIGPRTARAVAECIRLGLVRSCHDCSDGGLLVAVAEILIASGAAAPAGDASGLSGLIAKRPGTPALGIDITQDAGQIELFELAFSESPSRYVIEIKPEDYKRVRTILTDFGGLSATTIGTLAGHGRLVWESADVNLGVEDLAQAWLAPLDW